MRSLFNRKDDVTAVKLKMAARRSKNPAEQFQGPVARSMVSVNQRLIPSERIGFDTA